jgi:hypothetical protein
MFPIKPMPETNNFDPHANESCPQSAAQKFISFAFGKLVQLWPADSRDWALAMQAELPQMESTQQSLHWLAGGIMSLGKAWWNQLIYGGNPQEVVPAKLPGIATAILLLLAISSFALPGMRQGVVAIFDTWNFSRSYLGSAQLQKMGSEAEQNRDASTLAFVAMRLPANSPEKVRWANLAVSLDPSLTWIYFQMQDERERPDANFSERIARLQKWDPNNAVPYLMEAQQSFESFGSAKDGTPAQWVTSRDYRDHETEITKHPEWISAMEKAFQSPHFNDYQNERFNLNLAIQRKFAMNRPVDLVYSTLAARIPDLLNVRVYATWLTYKGEQRGTAGDNSAAAEDYWRAAHFGQRMELESGPDGIERLIAISILKNSFEKLKNLYQRTGRADEAKYAAFELENATTSVVVFRENNWRLAEATSLPSWSALMIQIVSLLILVAALLSCVALLWLVLRISGAPVSRLASHRNACLIARIAPVLLVLLLGLFYANYFPYLRSFNEASPRFAQHLTSTFGGLLKVPFSFSQFWTYGHGEVYFWTGSLAIGCVAVLILLIRMPARGKMEKQVA